MKKTIRPSDDHSNVLAEAALAFSNGASAITVIRNWLLQQLSAQEFAKLGQGGHTQNQIPLRQVFIDLPVINTPNTGSHPTERARFLKTLLSSAPLVLADVMPPRKDLVNLDDDSDASSTGDEVEPSATLAAAGRSLRSRFSATLLIGGPGQGKSTLGQLACQLHRASLLWPFIDEMTVAQSELVASFVESKQVEGEEAEVISAPLKPLLPLQVSLPDLSEWLAARSAGESVPEEAVPSIISFLADQPGARQAGLTGEVLYIFAKAIPTLIVLDGFDEIGATQDRARLVAAASQLMSKLRDDRASAQVLATTRPQGYAGELSNIGIKLRPRFLAPLLREEALEYAGKLVKEKIPDVDFREKTLARLHEAAKEPATSRLLTTPLQVTILTALVQQLGRAPRERWNLFFRYFSYTYDREIERGTYASRMLADYRSHIEKIHARVGLLLQVEAERAGGAAARMSRQLLEDVIREVLAEDEISEDDLNDLVKEIAAAAEQRLVFLVEPEPNRFGFEIRSLQEFMAAWAITSGRDSQVEQRLMQLAKAPMFRNVVLFIASKLFSEGSPLRDVLALDVCGALDEDSTDAPAQATKAGAMLALETLEEGAVLSQPKRARALMQRAAQLLALPANNEHSRLALVMNDDILPAFQQTLEQLEVPGTPAERADPIALCVTLINLTNLGITWAQQKLIDVWSALPDPSVVLRACRDLEVPLYKEVTVIVERVLILKGLNFAATLSFPEPSTEGEGALLPWIVAAFDEEPWERESQWHCSTFSGREPLGRPFPMSIADTLQKKWRGWIAVAQFQYTPSSASLATTLEEIAEAGILKEMRELVWNTYWPLASCMHVADNEHDLRQFAERIRCGELGDLPDWSNAELRWKKSFRWDGRMTELLTALPWSKRSIQYAPPFWSLNVWRFLAVPTGTPPARILARMRHVQEAFCNCKNARAKGILAIAAVNLLNSLPSNTNVGEFRIADWLNGFNIQLSQLSRHPRCIPQQEWASLIREITPKLSVGFFEPADVHRFLATNVISSHILAIINSYISTHTSVGPRHGVKVSLRKEAIASLKRFAPQNEVERANLAIARIYLGDVRDAEIDDVLLDIRRVANDNVEHWTMLLSAVQAAQKFGSCPTSMLVKTFGLVRSSYPQATSSIDLLRDELQSRKSGLQNQISWNRLGLPLPVPTEPLRQTVRSINPTRPICLEEVKLHDVRGIEKLHLRFPKMEDDKGQWIVVIGPNGIGKTTLLRSIALALRDTKNPAIWPKGAFSTSWTRAMNSPLLKSNESRIDVTLQEAGNFICTLRGDQNVVVSQSPELQTPSIFPIFAYGCRRGSALGGAPREVNLGTDDGPEIATLFDDSASLIHAETWIIQLDGEAQKSQTGMTVYRSVVAGLLNLLNLEDIYVDEKRVWVKEHDGPPLPFSSLSDGYLTSAGWFVDLIARWIDLLERNGLAVPSEFLSEMRGLVLIDEIDLHLHPRWQIEIIARTRSILPSMSFVATTHNPLTLVGAQAEEIWVLSADEESGETLCQQGAEAPLLLTGGQIYRRYFGIEDVYPERLGRALHRYAFLSGYGERSQAEETELVQLIKELDEAGIRPQWDVAPPANQSA